MSVCRVCLAENVRMHSISNTRYQKIYENVSSNKLKSEDGRPDTVCYICLTQLQKFCKFIDMSQNAEEILTKRILGIKGTEDKMKLVHNLTVVVIDSMIFVDGDKTESEPEISVTIKEEPIDIDESLEFKEEYLEPPNITLNDENMSTLSPLNELSPHGGIPNEVIDDRNNIDNTTNNELCLPVADSTWPTFSNMELSLNQIKSEPIDTTYNDENSTLAQSLNLFNLRASLQKITVKNIKYMPNTVRRNFESKYYCSICFYGCHLEKTLKRHMEVHNQSYPFLCKYCSYRFMSKEKLAKHFKFCTVCSFCGKRFTNIKGLRIHIRLHSGEQPYYCDICGRGFNQKTNLQTHLRVHSREKQYPCLICKKTFPFKSILQRHMVGHTENNKQSNGVLHNFLERRKRRPSPCGVCGRVLQSKEGLIMHMRLHTGQQPFECERCNRIFNQKVNLRTHVERIHAGDTLFSCRVCYKMFPINEELKNHLVSHGEVLFSRDFEIFQQKHIYMIHQNVHNGQATAYHCDMCKFKTRVLSY